MDPEIHANDTQIGTILVDSRCQIESDITRCMRVLDPQGLAEQVDNFLRRLQQAIPKRSLQNLGISAEAVHVRGNTGGYCRGAEEVRSTIMTHSSLRPAAQKGLSANASRSNKIQGSSASYVIASAYLGSTVHKTTMALTDCQAESCKGERSTAGE